MIRKRIQEIIVVVMTLPMFVSAQTGAWCVGMDCSFKQFVQYATGTLMRPIMTLLVSLTVVLFLWGTALFVGYAGDASKRQEGRKKMFAGIIALAILMSFWGLAKVVSSTFFG